jgi:two-component system C4-dicarboxylate transport sensor histidine kinase DctB
VISDQLVRTAGGTLRAFNRDAGGACFTIELPLAADPLPPGACHS